MHLQSFFVNCTDDVLPTYMKILREAIGRRPIDFIAFNGREDSLISVASWFFEGLNTKERCFGAGIHGTDGMSVIIVLH